MYLRKSCKNTYPPPFSSFEWVSLQIDPFIDVRVWGTGMGRADGDVVTIDAETNQLSMNVSDEEIAARLKKWKAPRLKVNRGTLAKYTHLVGDASHGVCSIPPLFIYSFLFFILPSSSHASSAISVQFSCFWASHIFLATTRGRRFKSLLNVDGTNHSYA